MTVKKKIVRGLIIGGLFMLIGTANIYAANTAFVSDDNVNVRVGANLDAAVLSKLPNGTTLNPLSVEGDWIKIKQADGSSAYVARQFVKVVEADGVVADDGVNIRALAGTDSEVLGKVNAGTVLTVTGAMGEFYSVKYNGSTAFIHKEFIYGDLVKILEGQSVEAIKLAVVAKPESVYALVTSSDGLNLRKAADKDSEILAKLSFDDVLDVLQAGGEWHQVSYNGAAGYVSAEFVSIHTGQKPDRSTGTKIIEYAKQFMGTPYVWAGTNLKSGVDCSGFVYAVMRDNGIALNRSSRDQYQNDGYAVSKDSLKPGDLVFFDTTNATNQGYVSHVGLYIGGGEFIESSSGRQKGVIISSLYSDYYIGRYVGAKRVL